MRHLLSISIISLFWVGLLHPIPLLAQDEFNSKTTLLASLPENIDDDKTDFSRDGQKVAYVFKKGGKWVLAVNGQEGRPYDEIGDPALNYDGKTIAYQAKKGKRWFVVVNGIEGKK